MKLAWTSYTDRKKDIWKKIYLNLNLVVVFRTRNAIMNVSVLRVLSRLSEYNLQCSRAFFCYTQKNTNFDNTGRPTNF